MKFFASAVGPLLAALTACQAPPVTITDLQDPAPGNFGTARDVNDDGVIVGDLAGQAVEFGDAQSFERLPLPPGFVSCIPVGISNDGLIVGDCFQPRTDSVAQQPFIWDATRAIRPIDGLGVGNIVSSMSPNGMIVGYSGKPGTGSVQPWAYDLHTDTLTELPTPPNSDTLPLDINDAGEAVGSASVSGSGTWAVLWSGSPPTVTRLASPDCNGEARAINNHGLIVGAIWGPATNRPVQWSSSTALPVGLPRVPVPTGGGPFQVEVRDVNDEGVIVAQSRYLSGDSGADRGTLWTANLTAVDLGIGLPRAINSSGLVVGSRNARPVKIEWRVSSEATAEQL
ncbi:MAG TPA: hypothetical protein VI072_17615 [Polyangiaceae bacterium]